MPLLGDPTAFDVAITAAYAGTVGTAYAAARRDGPGSQSRLVWSGVAVLLAALLVNQQLDLQNALIRHGSAVFETRGIAMTSPWVLIVTWLGLLACAVIGTAVLARMLRPGHPPGRLALVGLALVATYAITRAALFAHLVHGSWFEVRLPPYAKGLELLGLALISAGALRWQREDQAETSRNLEESHQAMGET